jgi:hypothetical protein
MGFKLEKGLATKKLSQLIPIENIVAYIGIYREMKETEIKKYAKVTPEAEIEQIRKILTRLVDKKYLTKEISRHFIGELLKSMAKSELAIESVISHVLKKEGFPEDRALNFLIYALIYDCKLYTKKMNYKVIAEFLQEQTIAWLEYYDIGKRYRRLNERAIREYLRNYLLASDKFRDVVTDIFTSKGATVKAGFLTPDAVRIISELFPKKHP